MYVSSKIPMIHATGFPLYVLLEEESRDVLVSAEEVLGFFGESAEQPSETVFLGVHEVNEGRRRVEDAILEVMNFQGKKIGEYFIGRAVLGDIDAEGGGGRASSISYRFFGNHCEHLKAAEIWRHWASVAALQKDEWLQWPTG